MKKFFLRLLPITLICALFSLNTEGLCLAAGESGMIYAEDWTALGEAVYSLFEEYYSEDYFSVISFRTGESEANKDGKKFSLGGEVYVENGEIMLPSRALSEIAGAEVGYRAEDNCVEVSVCGVAELEFGIGSASYVSGGEEKTLETEVAESDGVSFLPLGEIADELNLEVEKSEDESEVCITRPYQTMRLIVGADSDPETYGAVCAIRGADGTYILQYDSENAAREAAERLSADGGVEYAEPDLYVTIESTPLDDEDMYVTVESELSDEEAVSAASSHTSWGADTVEIDAYNEYLLYKYGDVSALPDVTVAVVDTGIDYTHSFLSGRISDAGYDLCGSDTPQDENGHGTHVSGIIVDMTLANVQILPIRVLTASTGGSVAILASGINYAVDQGVDVINMSLGAEGTSTLLTRAVNNAYSAGIPCVAAAGNGSFDVSNYTPANVDAAFAISATMSDDSFASSFSNYGSGIDFAAPGYRIYSSKLSGTFGYLSGTSQAAPHVTAAIAMLKSDNKSYSIDEIYDILAANAVDLGASGKDNYFGNGRISMLTAADAIIISDTGVSSGSVSVSFKNLTLSDVPAAALFAVYGSDESFLQCKTFDFDLASGGSKSYTLKFGSSIYSCEIFLWSGIDDMVPLCEPETLLNSSE